MSVPLELLACPACRGSLTSAAGILRCSSCAADYEIRGGVPILMIPDDRARYGVRFREAEGATMAARYGERASGSAVARLKRALRPPLPLIHNPAEPQLPAPAGSANLWIGGAGRATPGFINLDLHLFPGVNLVANAERLPFRDAVLDSVECDAVLEHAENPERLVCEILRVLNPHGLVHAVVPFCHPYHAYPSDFRRWTQPGLTRLLEEAGFQLIAAGVRTGPMATLLAFTLEYAKVLLGGGALGKSAYTALGWILFPLRYADLLLYRSERAALLANHVYALARKR